MQPERFMLASLTTLSGYLDSEAVAPNPDNSWKTAPLYTPTTAPFQLRMASLKKESGSIAYHKFASQYWEYKAIVGFTGGRAPFRVTLLEAPAGATIGGSTQTQAMTRTLDSIGGGVYKFELPLYNNVIRWQPGAGDVGATRKFKILIEDNGGQQRTNTHYVTVGESPFVYADATVADDSGAGTWAAPKKTFNAAHNNANKICVYKTAGTYSVTFGGLNNSDNRSRNHIAIPETGVVFNMSSEQFGCSTAAQDIAFLNIEFNGSVNTNPNCRVFHLSGKVDRAIWYNCKWRNVQLGTNAGDNPACIAFMNLSQIGDPAYVELPSDRVHTDICLIGCDVNATVDSQQITIFGGKNVCIKQNTANYKPTVTLVGGNNNGSSWIHLKDGCSQVSVNDNVCLEGGFLLAAINFSNQRGFYCKDQEANNNLVRWSQGFGISFNRQATVAGNIGAGQTIGGVNMRCIRNTAISNGSGQLEFLKWPEMAGAENVIVEDNIIATTNANAISTQTASGYTSVGVNQKLATSDFSANKLSGAARANHLGKRGEEIASTLVV